MDALLLGAILVLIALVLLLIFLLFSRQSSVSDQALTTITEIKNIGETIYQLSQQQKEAEKLGQSLKDLLQAPKLRGSYGEAVLEEMLERILPKGLWKSQYAITPTEWVDCVVTFKDVIVPIDAKFPRDDYMRYLSADLPEDKSRHWRDFEKAVRRQITSIETKYIKPEAGTADFALMFIPSEAIYYETIAEKNSIDEPSTILDFAQEHHVMPVSPNTFYAFLQIILLGIRNIEVIKNARKLQVGLTSLQKTFALFYKKYEEMGRELNKATEAHRISGTHIERYKRNLEDTLNLESLQEESQALPDDISSLR